MALLDVSRQWVGNKNLLEVVLTKSNVILCYSKIMSLKSITWYANDFPT